jgi:hypothetical protein
MLNAATIFAEAQAKVDASAAAAASRNAAAQGAGSGYTAPGSDGTGNGAGKGKGGPDAVDALNAGLVITDPLLDPRYLMEQQVGAALNELRIRQASEQMSLVEQTNQGVLDSFLLNNEYMLAAEQAKNATLGASLGNLAQMAMQQGGVLGKFGKAYAIAQTIWSTGTAIMNAMSQVPYPANIAVAAATAAMGVAQLANIKKTNIGSGAGSITAAKGGGSGGSSSALRDTAPAAPVNEKTEKSAVQVIFNGPVIETESTGKWLADVLRDAADNRDMVFFSANSRQAMELGA